MFTICTDSMPSFSQVCRLPSGCFTAARVVHVAGAAACHLLAHPPVQVCVLHHSTSNSFCSTLISRDHSYMLVQMTHFCQSSISWPSSMQPPLLAYSTDCSANPPDCPGDNIRPCKFGKSCKHCVSFLLPHSRHHLLLPCAGTGTTSWGSKQPCQQTLRISSHRPQAHCLRYQC